MLHYYIDIADDLHLTAMPSVHDEIPRVLTITRRLCCLPSLETKGDQAVTKSCNQVKLSQISIKHDFSHRSQRPLFTLCLPKHLDIANFGKYCMKNL